MKLFRFGKSGTEQPGVLLGERRLDVSAFGEDFGEKFFASDGISRLTAWLRDHAGDCPEVSVSTRLGPCVARPSKIICVGLNYARHAAEGGVEVPKEPVIFLKAPSAICGPNDDVILPRDAEKVDWEIELAFVIGRGGAYIRKEEAMKHVAGYCVMNDYSERAYQLERGGQWTKGKSHDSFAPLGPFLVTADEVPDPHNLRLWLKVNGATMQDSNTSDLVFQIPTVLSYISQFMRLVPGDVISTGTPEGVGFGLKPPRYLKPGDKVEYGIEELGSALHQAVAYESQNQ
jgi:2-keto-4-pentenoate hydratase/2-oxohepta-3-ene-1,7-dioic acid hydratase in catechol pathway